MKTALPVVLDEAAALALAKVIHQIAPEDYGVDPKAWYRALDALSPLLPHEAPIRGSRMEVSRG